MTITNEQIAELFAKAKRLHGNVSCQYVLQMADALETLAKEREWKPVSEAPTDPEKWFLGKHESFPSSGPYWIHYVGPQNGGEPALVHANRVGAMMWITHFMLIPELPLPPEES